MVASPRTIEKTGVLRITASVQYRAVIGSMEKLREEAAMKGFPSDNLEETFLALVDEDNRKRRHMQ